MTHSLLSVLAAVAVSTVLVALAYYRRSHEVALSPLAEALAALRSIQSGPSLSS